MVGLQNSAWATDWYVDDNAPNDPGPGDPTVRDPLEDGSKDHPFDKIQEAINAAEDGDMITVQPGNYYENVRMKNGIVLQGAGADVTTIDGRAKGHVVVFNYASGCISGFTIRNSGSSPLYSAGVFTSHCSVAIKNCVIVNNSFGIVLSSNSVGVVEGNRIMYNTGFHAVRISSSNGTIKNNVIAYNSWQGINCSLGSPSIINNTIVNNASFGIYFHSDSIQQIHNNIIINNKVGIIGGSRLDVPLLDIAFNNAWNNDLGNYMTSCCMGEGNIEADPLFVDTVKGNFHLQKASPCIDAGCDGGVYEDIEGNIRPWDYPGVDNNGDEGEFDMGAYEYVGVEAALKLTPRILNCRSNGKWVKAHLTLPEGFAIEDIDSNTPAILQPLNLTSAHLKISLNADGLVKVNASFDRKEFCGAVGDLSEGLTVLAYLTDGTVFYGTTSVRIITPGLQELAELSSYWLQSNCQEPDWCNGLDLNHDTVVNMLDFALFQKSNIEFIDK